MTVESKVVVTAEDRTAAAFAAIERNTGKTAMAMLKLQGQMLKLAGVGSLVAFFRSGAQSTEKWRDEMARLDEITEKFFNTAADGGKLDPFIQAVKMVYTLAFGAAVAIENLGLAIGSLASAAVDVAKLNFAEARRTMELSSQDMAENEERFRQLREEINKPAKQGLAKHREEEADRVKEANRKLKQAEEERLKIILKNAEASQDAIRAEMEFSEGNTGAGLTAMGEAAVDERFKKEQELRLRESELRAQQRDRDIQELIESQMTEQELIDQKYADQLQALYDARSLEYVTEVEFKARREQLEIDHQARLGDIWAQAQQQAQRITEMSAYNQTKTIIGMYAQMSASSAQHNKAAFTANKIFAATLAVMKMYESAVTSFAWGARHGGPVAGAIAAAAAITLQLPNVNAIKNAQFGSTSSAPSIGGGSATPVFDVNSGVPDLSAQRAAAPRQVNFYVQSDSGMVSMDWLVNQFGPRFNEAIGDGFKVNFMPA